MAPSLQGMAGLDIVEVAAVVSALCGTALLLLLPPAPAVVLVPPRGRGRRPPGTTKPAGRRSLVACRAR